MVVDGLRDHLHAAQDAADLSEHKVDGIADGLQFLMRRMYLRAQVSTLNWFQLPSQLRDALFQCHPLGLALLEEARIVNGDRCLVGE
ncbi:MAG TPA: hypothetical protein VGT82_14880 [Ktedonobacteraceae bacterium]|nr:hypothetical protein [Ktedonobacteraceae bacterium]